MSETAAKIAQYLLEVKAVKLQPTDPFKWSSGWNSPIYCDNRITLSFSEVRNFIKTEMAQRIVEDFPECNALCGVATAGIAIGALVADEMDLPYSYCRPKPKEHGMKNQLEGRIAEGSKVVVVEDLISTGGSSLKVVDFLRNSGIEVLGMASIFTYGFTVADKNMKDADCSYFSLSSYSELLPAALKSGDISESDISALNKWREAPSEWG